MARKPNPVCIRPYGMIPRIFTPEERKIKSAMVETCIPLYPASVRAYCIVLRTPDNPSSFGSRLLRPRGGQNTISRSRITVTLWAKPSILEDNKIWRSHSVLQPDHGRSAVVCTNGDKMCLSAPNSKTEPAPPTFLMFLVVDLQHWPGQFPSQQGASSACLSAWPLLQCSYASVRT